MTAALAEACDDLTALWPALAAALERDTAGMDMPGSHQWIAATVVNADVLAAMVTLRRDIPHTTRRACETLGELWQHRDIPACLRALPRLAERMGHIGLAREQAQVTGAACDWLRLTKRALGLRKPDMPVGYRCPYAASIPEDHLGDCMLFAAGMEGFLRPAYGGGWRVEWAVQERIYCASEDCGASWPGTQWEHLGRMLGAPALTVAS